MLHIGQAKITSDEITEIREKAKNGDADAQFSLFKLRRDGESRLITQTEAQGWFQKALAAKHNHATAINKAENIEKIHAETVALFNLDEEEIEDAVELYFHWGISHYTGENTVKDFSSALNYFKFCAERGHLKSMFILGLIYADENVIEYDPAESEKLISRIAREAPLETLRWAAATAVEDMNYPNKPQIGIQLLKAAGDRFSDGWCYFHLSGIYGRKGHFDLGLEAMAQNDLAIAYGLKACALGYEDAYRSTGKLINSFGTTDQKIEFHKILKEVANSGITAAQGILTLQYIQGIPGYLESDNTLAYKWMNILIAGGDSDNFNINSIKQYRMFLIKKMTPEEISEGKRLSKEWLETNRTNM